MFRVFWLFSIIFILTTNIYGQNTFSITGTVKDNDGPIPGAGVYISGYKIATVTDTDGKFRLPKLAPGSYDILVQMMGYLPYSKNIVISDKSIDAVFLLKESTVTLNEVVIRVDPNRQKYINQFKEYFIGASPNAKYCKILNPQVLRVNYDITTSTLTVKSDDFLIVENKALGYRIKYMLEYFEYNNRTHIIYYSGKPFFEDLKVSNSKRKKYSELREIAYHGSAQHFFKSLYAGNSEDEGFLINKIIQIPNPNRMPDTIINKNLLLLKNPLGKSGIKKNAGKIDTSLVSFWHKQLELPKTIDVFNSSRILTDTLVHYYNKDLKYLNYSNSLCIIYTKERESTAYSNSGFWVRRPLNMPDYQLSVLKLSENAFRFYENGSILDARSVLFEGFWAYEKVADMVPRDYIPISKR
ncbi:hypothetical protein D3C87_107100 [compost metagenome]